MNNFNDFNEKLNVIINELKELSVKTDKRFTKLENTECISCVKKKKDENPFTWDYIRKNVFTKKYLFTVILKSLTKTIVLAFLTLFFLDLWNPFIESIKVKLPWNNLKRKYELGKNVNDFIKWLKTFF